jgi:hypothetical protein
MLGPKAVLPTTTKEAGASVHQQRHAMLYGRASNTGCTDRPTGKRNQANCVSGHCRWGASP